MRIGSTAILYSEALDSNIGPESCYPEDVRGFPQSLQANVELLPQIMPRPLPSTAITIHYSLIIHPLTLYSLRYRWCP
jgi:hypothetical protein